MIYCIHSVCSSHSHTCSTQSRVRFKIVRKKRNTMRAKRLVLLIGLLAIVAATTMAVTQPSAQSATVAKKEAVLQFSITIGDPDFDLAIGDPDFDLLGVVPIIRDAAN